MGAAQPGRISTVDRCSASGTRLGGGAPDLAATLGRCKTCWAYPGPRDRGCARATFCRRTQPMSDPRDFEGDPNLSRNRYVGRQSTSQGAGWIIAAVIAAIVLGVAAYSIRGGGQMSAANKPETTSGQSTPAPVPSNPPPPATQAPAPPPARSQ